MPEKEREARVPEGEAEVAEGSTAEVMLEMIIRKEEEIKAQIQAAESDAQRHIEEAKLDAAAMKREAVQVDVGEELRQKELEKARREAERIMQETGEEAGRVRTLAGEHVERAVEIVLNGVLPGKR